MIDEAYTIVKPYLFDDAELMLSYIISTLMTFLPVIGLSIDRVGGRLLTKQVRTAESGKDLFDLGGEWLSRFVTEVLF